ncbi:MAG TPA: GNAT family N-acetyltransferase [Terriglobales bacterium]|nr:GNAT family N-acetyltransferase [Terriglobales bacterium]
MQAIARISPAVSSVSLPERPQLTSLPIERLAGDSELRAQWRALIASQWQPYRLYQSPEWFDHVLGTRREQLLAPQAWSDGKHLLGLALPYLKNHVLPFEVRQYPFYQCRLRTIAFLGAEPLFPCDPTIYDALFSKTLAESPEADGFYLHSVPTEGFLWQHLHDSRWVEQNLLLYMPHKVRRFDALELPSSFEEYLAAQFRKKKRYNLKRQLRLLEEHANGSLELRRIEHPGDVGWFASAAGRVAQRSWQARWLIPDTFESLRRPAWMEDLARRGMLRSYVMLCGGSPCAMVLGYQHGDTFHYSETSYDESFAKFSPGSVLMYLMIADLTEHRRPRWVSFGAGESRYKQEFSNRSWNDASILLLRRNRRGLAIRTAHGLFRGAIDIAKDCRDRLRRPPQQESSDAADE